MYYDLTTLRSPNAEWSLISPSNGLYPPARTNHTVVTYQDRLYLFGGTDGKLWYSDTWCYDPSDNSWTCLDCSGFIPAPCEGHAATIVGDIMYVFGGRSSQGKDLGTLSALKLTTKKWFTFQNLGPGPSPRSGHSMTAFSGHKVLVMGGECAQLAGGYENSNESPNYEGYEAGPQLSNVFVLDTLRINYPADSDTTGGVGVEGHQGPVHHQILSDRMESRTPSAASGNLQGVVTGGSSTPPSSLSTPSTGGVVGAVAAAGAGAVAAAAAHGKSSPYVQEYPTVRSPDEDHDDNKSNTTFESIDEEGFKQSPERTSNIPGAWQQVSSPSSTHSESNDEPIQVQKLRTSPRIDTSVKGLSGIGSNSPPPDDNTPTPSTLTNQHDRSIDSSFSEPISILDQSTPRGSQVHLSNGNVENVSQVIEQLKASNSWYESELAAAKNAGYVTQSNVPVDVFKLRRVSQRLTQDNNQSLSERDILVTALGDLKNELRNVQNDIHNQAEAASNRILEVEKERDAVVDELNQLKQNHQNGGSGNGEQEQYQATIASLQKELSESKESRNLLLSDGDSLSTIDDLKVSNAQLEQQLRNQADRLVVSEHEASQFKLKLENFQGQHQELTSSTAEKVAALAAAAAAITAAQSKSNLLSTQLEDHKTVRESLQSKILDLERELNEYKQKTETYEKELSDSRNLLQTSEEQNEHSSRALGDGINKIVTMWAASKLLGSAAGAVGSREIDENEDPRYIDLQNQVDLANQLHVSHKDAAEKATTQLTQSLTQLSALKKELAQSESAKNDLQAQLSQVHEELESTKQELASHETLLDDHKKSLNELSEKQSEATSTQTKEFDEKLDKALEQHKLESDERYRELEAQYKETLQYVRNSDKALGKTRDELSRHKDLNNKLQEEINELRLRTQQDDEEEGNTTEKSINSIGSNYHNKHFDLQLRDLKAQVIILQEERDELRASTLELKKKAINNAHDIEDAKQETSRLAQENSKLLQRAREAEDKVSVLLHNKRSSRDIIDPESGQTLDSFSNDLEKIRNERERLSGILRESPTGEEREDLK